MGESTPAGDGSACAGMDAALAADPHLRAAVAALAQLELGVSGLAAALERVAELALCAVPAADGAAVSLGDVEGAATVATVPFVDEVEDIAHRLHEGPCVSAIDEHRVVNCGSLGGEQRWPHFGPRAGRLGVHSVLCLPLERGSATVGAVDVYARHKDAFDEAALQAGRCFAAVAAVTVANARALEAGSVRVAQLEHALQGRAVIERAVGILISRTGADAGEAFDRLRTMSQSQHRKVSAIAEAMVQVTARRARARLAGGAAPAEGAQAPSP